MKPLDLSDLMVDSRGRYVPRELVRPIDIARDELVKELVTKAREVSHQLAVFRSQLLEQIQTFVDQSAAQYGVDWGGTRGNVTLLSFDGKLRIQRAIAEHLVFDERLQAAKQLIDECVRTWSEGANANIRMLVQHAFQVDKAGKVSAARVLGLRQLEIDDSRWSEAMRAIGDSIQTTGSTTYVRFYEKVGDEWMSIPLDITGVR